MLFRDKYYFLSNMYPCTIEYNGIVYTSVEAAFQAQKEPKRAKEFATPQMDGYKAKKLGRHVNLRPDWDNIKLDIMKDILKIKFSNPDLAKMLKSVNEPIVEHNTWNDTYWGVCNDRGENHLGKLLTDIKNSLQ